MFDQFFADLGIAPAGPGDPLPATVQALDRGMARRVAEGEYPDVPAVMLAAEWTYAARCGRAHAGTIPSPVLWRRVALHAEPEFPDGAARLCAETDACGADKAGAARPSARFRRALELETGFRHAADATRPVRRRNADGRP